MTDQTRRGLPLHRLLLALLPVLMVPACAPLNIAERVEAGPDAAEVERDLYIAINNYRAEYRLPPLQERSRLATIARGHTDAMASGRRPFSHDNSRARFDRIITEFDVARLSENVAWSTPRPDIATAILDIWIASKPHREAILDSYNLTGIAVTRSPDGRYFVTQMFVEEKKSEAGLIL